MALHQHCTNIDLMSGKAWNYKLQLLKPLFGKIRTRCCSGLPDFWIQAKYMLKNKINNEN